MAGERVRVVGLKELRRDLRKLSRDETWKGDLRNAGLQAATIVANDARASALRASNPRMGSAAANTIRPLASQTNARVAAGRANVPWAMGHIWGSERFGQFPPRRKGGYHLYPAIERQSGKVIEIYTDAMAKLIKKHLG